MLLGKWLPKSVNDAFAGFAFDRHDIGGVVNFFGEFDGAIYVWLSHGATSVGFECNPLHSPIFPQVRG